MFTKLSLLTIALLAVSSLEAGVVSDVSLKYGLTSLDNDNGWKLKNNTFNLDTTFDLGYAINPRLDLTYIDIKDKQKWGGVDSLIQGAISAQYQTQADWLNFKHNFYLFAGIGYEYVKDGTDVFDSLPFYQGGLGFKLGLSNNLNLVTEYRALQVYDTNNDKHDEDNENTILIGLNYEFGAPVKEVREVPKPVAKPAPVVAPVIPAPAPVIDSDHDGVPDDMDDCPGTVLTEDMEVSERGCAITIAMDSDGDGVEDKLDQCKNTPDGTEVDVNGCAKPINLHINFKSSSAQIKEESKSRIADFAEYLKSAPKGTTVTIDGYTDNSGNNKKNIALSSKRAYAVKRALMKLGVDKDMIKAVGHGSTNPIAPNSTLQGRALNRRIEATINYQGE